MAPGLEEPQVEGPCGHVVQAEVADEVGDTEHVVVVAADVAPVCGAVGALPADVVACWPVAVSVRGRGLAVPMYRDSHGPSVGVRVMVVKSRLWSGPDTGCIPRI